MFGDDSVTNTMFGDDTSIIVVFHSFASALAQSVSGDTNLPKCASNLVQCRTSVRASNGSGIMFGDDRFVMDIFPRFAMILEGSVSDDTNFREWASNLAVCCTSVRASNGKGMMVENDRISIDLSHCFAMILEGSVREDTNFQECATNLPEC